MAATAVRAEDLLPSWNDGPAKQAITEFVQTTTAQGGPEFAPPTERIAAFDQDGALWVEHPMYTQMVYCLDRVPSVVKKKPELAKVEPFKTVLSGNCEALAKLSMEDLEKILAATLTGMSVETFNAEVKKWLETARDPILSCWLTSRRHRSRSYDSQNISTMILANWQFVDSASYVPNNPPPTDFGILHFSCVTPPSRILTSSQPSAIAYFHPTSFSSAGRHLF